MEIGKMVRHFRELQELSQVELAIMANISQPHISQIERGEKEPTFSTLKKITEALGITLIEFFTEYVNQ